MMSTKDNCIRSCRFDGIEQNVKIEVFAEHLENENEMHELDFNDTLKKQLTW